MSAKPVFDPKKDHGVVAHGSLNGQEPGSLPAFFQDGNYFKPDHSFHSSDGQPRKFIAEPVKAPEPKPAVTEAELAALLADPRAAELLALPRDELTKLVVAAEGPVLAGDQAHQMMAAWLIKNTMPDHDGL